MTVTIATTLRSGAVGATKEGDIGECILNRQERHLLGENS